MYDELIINGNSKRHYISFLLRLRDSAYANVCVREKVELNYCVYVITIEGPFPDAIILFYLVKASFDVGF